MAEMQGINVWYILHTNYAPSVLRLHHFRIQNSRKNIQKNTTIIEFDEEYQAGNKITTTSHHLEEYTLNGSKINYHLIISDVKASGFLGFFYRIFGKKNIGNAILKSHKTYFEK